MPPAPLILAEAPTFHLDRLRTCTNALQPAMKMHSGRLRIARKSGHDACLRCMTITGMTWAQTSLRKIAAGLFGLRACQS